METYQETHSEVRDDTRLECDPERSVRQDIAEQKEFKEQL